MKRKMKLKDVPVLRCLSFSWVQNVYTKPSAFCEQGLEGGGRGVGGGVFGWATIEAKLNS